MRFSDIMRLCLSSLQRRKSRTILTMLGVVVGCCSIVVMVSLGEGMSEQNQRMLESMGDLRSIQVYTGGGGSMMMGSTQSAKLNENAINTMRSIPHVKGASALDSWDYTATLSAQSGRYVTDYTQVMGVDISQMENIGIKLLSGRLPQKAGEVLAGQYTDYAFRDKFRNGSNDRRYAPGQNSCFDMQGNSCTSKDGESTPFFDITSTKLTLTTGQNYSGNSDMGSGMAEQPTDTPPITRDYVVVGVVESDYNKGQATDDGIVMSMEEMRSLRKAVDPSSFTQQREYSQAIVVADELSHVADVESTIQMQGFSTFSSEQMRKELDESMRTVNLILGGIGAVALFVAALGIANTMIMSVTERTREIGIMKSLGCTLRDIRVMFLAEAGIIGFLGGFIGCIISAIVSAAINIIGVVNTAQMTGESADIIGAVFGGADVTRLSVIPWWLMLFAIAFATLVGIVFGFQPANKAVKIPALDAIKSEE